jgi:hypothetical protein
MNIEDGDAVPQSIAAPHISVPAKIKSKKRQGRAKNRSRAGAGQEAGDSLNTEARRLLGALAQPETSAFIDPTDESSVLIHRRQSGVSVGAGRFAATAAEALVSADLACWQRTSSGRRSLLVTKAGEAHLRRSAAPDKDLAFLHQHRATDVRDVETDTGTARVRVDAEKRAPSTGCAGAGTAVESR